MAYRRLKLPHLHPVGASFSLLFLLKDAVPTPLLRELSEERRQQLAVIRSRHQEGWQQQLATVQRTYDLRLDYLLRKHQNQSHALANPEAAAIVVDRIKKYDGQFYDLYAYSVMSNHVHLDIDLSIQLPDDWNGETVPAGYVNVDKLVNLIKGGSARYVNKLLGQTGQSLWMIRYRDRFIRNEAHLYNSWSYTLDNPVEAEIAEERWQHPFTGGMDWCKIQLRANRRVYPNVKFWLQQLAAHDEGRVWKERNRRKP